MPQIAATRPVAGQPIETAWGQQMHDAMEGTFDSLSESTVIAGTGAVTFARSFVAPPAVLAGAVFDGGIFYVSAADSVTTTGFTLVVRDLAGGVPGALGIRWIAFGTFA